jgi:hypothetical protein
VTSETTKGFWWTIHSSIVMDALRRVEAGEHPDEVMWRLYLDSDQDLAEDDIP